MLTWLGILFTFLWSTAAIAIKFGLEGAPPLTLATMRFLVAGTLLIAVLYGFLYRKKFPFPKGKEWGHVTILGMLNTTMYLGASFWALEHVSAGFFNLIVTTNPFVVGLLSTAVLKRKLSRKEWGGMGIAAIGIWIATIPSILEGNATMMGIIVLLCGMFSMALGSVYFKKIDLKLPGSVINTWQVFIGGILLLPVTIMIEGGERLIWSQSFVLSFMYLVIIISIATMLLWFYLLKQDAVKANNWLFLTPIFGYVLAGLFLNEAVTMYDMLATICVISGLYLTGNIKLDTKKR